MEVVCMLRRALTLCALCALLPAAALAQGSSTETAIGPRVGVSLTPDQFVFGGQAIVGEIAPNLTFDPSLELGFGDNVTSVAMNFDVHYHFVVQNSKWRPYAGGGIGVGFFDFDSGGSETDVGANLVVGASAPTKGGNRFFGELRIGLGDLADLKMMVGWNFKM
jgi:hypothetical protein